MVRTGRTFLNGLTVPDAIRTSSKPLGGLVSDVIQGMRSGSVEIFHEMTTGNGGMSSLHDANCSSPQHSPVNVIDTQVRNTPLVPTTRRVLAPPQDLSAEHMISEDEDEFVLSINENVDKSNSTSSEGAASTDATGSTNDASVNSIPFNDTSAEHVRLKRRNGFGSGIDEQNEANPSSCHHYAESDCSRALIRNSTGSVEYAGGSGPIDDLLGDKMTIDRLFLPIRQDGVFKEGMRKKHGAKHVFLHPRDMLSHAYLQTSPDGVLHVLPGWDHAAFIHDIAYRFETVHNYVGPVPFLGGDLCKIRTYRCQGVLACPASNEEYRKSHHCEVDPEDKNILESVEDLHPNEIARKKVIGIFNSLKEREERKKGFICGVGIPDVSDPRNVVACKGRAILVPRRSPTTGIETPHCFNRQLGARSQRRCDFFIGCSGYPEEHDRLNIRHYGRTIDIDNEFVPFLRRLMNGEEQVSVEPGECNFVRDKNKGKRTCPRHGLRLVELPCKLHRDDKRSNHEMTTFEPLDQDHLSIESKILYVSCKGSHLHPPPPPTEATVRKLRSFRMSKMRPA